jgi:hypothetical protein
LAIVGIGDGLVIGYGHRTGSAVWGVFDSFLVVISARRISELEKSGNS